MPQEPKSVFDIGTAAHFMVLEPLLFEQSIHVIDADNWRTKAAQQSREEARADGLLPLLAEDAQMIRDMRTALAADPVCNVAFNAGQPERSLFWKDPEFGIWCRSRPDWVPDHGRYLINYKTSTSANPDHVAKQVWNLSYFQSSSWEMDGCEQIFGKRPEKFALIVQSKKAPYLCTLHWLHAFDLQDGARLNRRARGIFARCLETNDWHGYWPTDNGPGGFETQIPFFARQKMGEMAENGGFMAPQDQPIEDAAT